MVLDNGYTKEYTWFTLKNFEEIGESMYKNEQTTARVDRKTAGKLKKLAAIRNVTVSELLRVMTERELEELSEMKYKDIGEY